DGAGGGRQFHELRGLGMGPHRRRWHHDHAAGAGVFLPGAAISRPWSDWRRVERMTLLITGGASGIGAETARRAAKRGHKGAINYRSREGAAKQVVADIAALGGTAVALPADMAREADIVRLFEETERAPGPVTPLAKSAAPAGGAAG